MGALYIQYEYWFAVFQLVTAMLGMGATLTLGDFKDVVKEPVSIGLGLVIQVLMVPLMGYLLINTFGLAGGVAIGVALIVAIPGGTTSNIFTFLARGNVPLSISITGITTLACLLTTPLILSWLITAYLPADFTMPTARIVTEIAVTLLLPLVVGMVLLRAFPSWAPAFSKWMIRASLLGIVLIVVGSASAGRLDWAAFGGANIGVICLLVVILGVATWLACKLGGRNLADCTAIEVEVVVRNINLAVLIKASLFPITAAADPIGDTVLFALLLYGLLQTLLAVVFIPIRRRASA